MDDFETAGTLIRPAALAMIQAYLVSGHDVVLPQMLFDPDELSRFEDCAVRADARFVERFLMDDADRVIARFHRRGDGNPDDPWHDQVRHIVADNGGDEAISDCCGALDWLLEMRTEAEVIPSAEGSVEATYQQLVSSLR